MGAELLGHVLTVAAALIGIPAAVLLAEVLAATLLARRAAAAPVAAIEPRPKVAVLVPAHNEGAGLVPTIEDIRAQLVAGDRLLVVADNCSDDTAAVARAAGAEVSERHDAERRGKGYALDWGIRHLSADPPDVLIIIDADCRLSEAAIERLAYAATVRPVQALYLMAAPAETALKVAEFTWRVKNWVRPLGLAALDLPCQLMGTGMAFPWPVISAANLASGHIVEDLKLGLELAQAGTPPVFCPSVQVTSQFPGSEQAARQQRERWEHGHVSTSLSLAPRLFAAAVRNRNLGALALALDVMVPPLTLLGALAVAMLFLSGLTAVLGGTLAAFWLSLANVAALAVAGILAWIGFGRDVLPASAFATLAAFAWSKLPIYWRLLRRGPIGQWIRTGRE